MKIDESLRTGRFFQGPSRMHRSHSAFWGIFAIVAFSLIIKSLAFIPEEIRSQIMITAMLIATFSMIPFDVLFSTWQVNVPNSNGCILVGRRPGQWIYTIIFLIVGWIGIWFGSGLWTLFWGVIFALLGWLIWELLLKTGATCKSYKK